MKVHLIAYTVFDHHAMWESTDGAWDDGDADPFVPTGRSANLSEAAGRGCYESWKKPNPETASTEGYLDNIIKQRHFSVLEHGAASFRLTHVSRSLTHELIRHRHFSYSQLSQRFVVLKHEDNVLATLEDVVVPPLLRDDNDAADILLMIWDHAVIAYEDLLNRATILAEKKGLTGRHAKKAAREAARAVLPNMTPTSIIVTGNHRAWREFFEKRGTADADAEIRELAVELFRQLSQLEPEIYQDMRVTTHIDGTSLISR